MAYFAAEAERARRAFRDQHECNGYCRDDRHATVIYVEVSEGHGEAEVAAGLREMLADLGAAYVSASYAPEAPPPAGIVATYERPTGTVLFEAALTTDKPYLVIWRVEVLG